MVRPLAGGKAVRPDVAPRDAELYMPMARPELADRFARVSEGSDAAVLEFCRRYGLVGYGSELSLFEEAAMQRLHPPCPDGDPVSWIVAHAKTVALLMELAEGLSDDARLRALVARHTVRTDDGGEAFALTSARRGAKLPGQGTVRLFAEPFNTVQLALTNTIDANLAGAVSRALLYEEQANGELGFTSYFDPRNLLGAIYWQLADAVTGGTLRQCALSKCQRPFIATSERQKYCPPAMGAGISSCMNRDKQQRFRAKRRPKSRRGRR